MLWVTQRLDPNLGITLKVDKQTTLWSQCTGPLLRHTPSPAVDGGKPAADLWFCNGLCVADMSLTTIIHVSMGLEERPQDT